MALQQLFIDFEFTMATKRDGLKDFVQEIIEVGIVSVIEGEIYDTFSSYVKPTRFPILTKYCKDFLKIEQRNIEQGITFKEMCLYLKLYNDLMPTEVIAWGGSDHHILKKNCNMTNCSYPFDRKILDLSQEHRRFFGTQNNTGLVRALEEYGKKPNGKAHKALDDALIMYEIYKLIQKDKKYLQKKSLPTIGERMNWVLMKDKNFS